MAAQTVYFEQVPSTVWSQDTWYDGPELLSSIWCFARQPLEIYSAVTWNPGSTAANCLVTWLTISASCAEKGVHYGVPSLVCEMPICFPG